MLSVAIKPIMLCHYADCYYGECHYAECRYAECRGAGDIDGFAQIVSRHIFSIERRCHDFCPIDI